MSIVDVRRKAFHHLLVSTVLVSIINVTVWFGVTFYVYVQTRSVFATGVISGLFLAMSALTGIWFGSLVDRHPKKTMMQVSSVVSLVLYLVAFVIYETASPESFTDPTSVVLWTLVVVLMFGVVTGNIRLIALPTLVTVLIPEESRDRANGLIGATIGVVGVVTNVISGVLVAVDGMFWVLVLALVVLAASVAHLRLVPVPERAATDTRPGEPASHGPAPDVAVPGGMVDLRGTIRVIGQASGLGGLIVFSAFNNVLSGVFLALITPYGLTLMSVQAWGLLWGVLSTGFIVGGLIIARTGLSRNPVRLLLIVNLCLWAVTLLFPVRSSIILLSVGMFIYTLLQPYAEASEQTILQKVVPYERQGRVFGFAQSVEQAASPLAAFLVAPIAQFLVVPFMTDGAGARAIGGWYGTGTDRGLALMFMLSGVVGLIVTVLAMLSRSYRQLSRRYTQSPAASAELSPTGQR
ncbi:MFS transporter [Micromonospora sp. NPDC048169]|uniref:MFS transporter n=1 Tax=unclassified Micromonospora TaxID=2617518 RepID=UPI0033E5FA89